MVLTHNSEEIQWVLHQSHRAGAPAFFLCLPFIYVEPVWRAFWDGLIWFWLCLPSPGSRCVCVGGVNLQWVNSWNHHTSLSTGVFFCDVSLWQDKRQLRAIWDSGFILFVLLAQWGPVSDFLCGPESPMKLQVCLEESWTTDCYINVTILTV